MEHIDGKQYEMRSYQEMQSLSAALTCLFLLYLLMPRLPRGLPRVLCVLPCLPIFWRVPFSTRPHFFRSTLSFLFLWVCPTKLLLRCWDIYPDYPGDGFLYFITTSIMPLRVKGRRRPHDEDPKHAAARTFQGALFLPLFQFLCFSATLNVLQYPSIPGWVNHALYCLLVYFGLEGVLGLFSGFTSLVLGLELHPFFDKPFLASSLSEFWGRRWNCLASYMLRETVYVPIVHFLSAGRHLSNVKTAKGSPQTHTSQSADVGVFFTTCKEGGTEARGGMQEKVETNIATIGKEFQNAGRVPLLARAVAMLASFIASGLFHELLFYCITQTHATWEVTMFFILHGVATVLEVFLRRKFSGRRLLPQPIAIACTVAFLYFSAAWLFMPPITRSGADLRILAEFHHMQNVVVDLFSRYRG